MKANKFILIEYNHVPYPEGFISEIKEIACHLDKNEIFENKLDGVIKIAVTTE